MMKKNIALAIIIVLLIFGGGIFENLRAAGIQIDPQAGLITTEDGGEATFLVRLTSPPVCPQNCFVQIYVSLSDITEGYIISPQSFNYFFDANNYDEFQEVTVRGVDDPFPDGDQDYYVRIQAVNTNDPNYSGLTQQASVTNIDNEGPYAPPTVILTGDPILNEGQAGTYDASNSYPPGSIVSYEWDWEYNGVSFIPSRDTGNTKTHAWMDDGNYRVAVRVTDFIGASDIDFLVVMVNDLAPSADFNADTREGGAPLTVNFTDESTSYDGIYIYSWDFGDGNIAIGVESPTHTYNAFGTYNVSLTVLEEDGDTNRVTKNNYITVLQAVNLWIEPHTMKMISFFHKPEDANAVSVFFGDEVRKNYQYKALFKIGTYNPELGNYIEYGANLIVEPGRGYWCYARDGLNISFNGVPVNPGDDIKVELLFDSNTNDGWNMIACPYNTNYFWDDVKVWGCDPNAKTIFELAMENDCNCIDRLLLWKWKNGTYVYYDPDPNSTCGNEPNEYDRDSDPNMRPNEGYWVKVKKENVYLSFPPLNMPKIKDSHPDVLRSNITSQEGKLPSASRKTFNAAGDDSPPAPLCGFRSDKDSFSETGSGGCFINNMSFGLPKDTLKKNDKFRIKR